MSGLFALRSTRGGQKADVEELRALAFDGQTTNFTVGQTITGGTSGATGILAEQADAGATGTLQLDKVSGVFQNNEALTDEGSGDGNANGTLSMPLLTPSDSLILQIDAEDMTKAEALEQLRHIEAYIHDMPWPQRG
jgi:hypothetical protein